MSARLRTSGNKYSPIYFALAQHYTHKTVHLSDCVILLCDILASCLINAQPLPAHRPDADNNSLAAQGHDRWLVAAPMPISLTAYAHFAAGLGSLFYWTRYFENICTVRQYRSDLSDQSALEIMVMIIG